MGRWANALIPGYKQGLLVMFTDEERSTYDGAGCSSAKAKHHNYNIHRNSIPMNIVVPVFRFSCRAKAKHHNYNIYRNLIHMNIVVPVFCFSCRAKAKHRN